MSVDRECCNGDGRPKRRYNARADARNVIRNDRVGNLAGCTVYRCAVCDYFHLGHYPQHPERRAELRARHREAS